MDRLSSVATRRLVVGLAVAAVAGACDRRARSEDAAASGRQRVNAVAAAPEEPVDPRSMCDVFHSAGSGPAFSWPALASDPPARTPRRWTWVNVWATWCKPCVDELPRLGRWQSELEDRVQIQYVSADEDDEAVAAYRERFPQLAATARVASVDRLPAWLESLGVEGASLPVHVFVDAGGRVRCVRASAVEDTDLPAIRALLR